MSEAADTSALATFEAKWGAIHPELALALRFVDPGRRRAHSAFACLVCELEHAAFAIREAEPAMIKLQWWAEEFARIGAGEARHPLTQALADEPAFATLPVVRWHAVVIGAIAQRDPEPAPDRALLLQGYAALYRPLALIEAALFVPTSLAATSFSSTSADSVARVRILSRALRETAGLANALRDGRLPLPLDVLARHRLARGELAHKSPQQLAALREWLVALGSIPEPGVGLDMGLGALAAATASADRWRAQWAARANDPLATLNVALARVPLRAVLATWRAARRSRG